RAATRSGKNNGLGTNRVSEASMWNTSAYGLSRAASAPSALRSADHNDTSTARRSGGYSSASGSIGHHPGGAGHTGEVSAAVLDRAGDQLQAPGGLILEPRVHLQNHRDVAEPVLGQTTGQRADVEAALRVGPAPVRVAVPVGVVQVDLPDAWAEVGD